MSAIMSGLGQYSRITSSACTSSRTKWYCRPICFVRAWYFGFWANTRGPWLFPKSTAICWIWLRAPTFFKSTGSYRISLVACVMAIYSASVVERAIELWFLLAQETALPFSRKIKPPTDIISWHDPQSASEYCPLLLLDLYCNLRVRFPAR